MATALWVLVILGLVGLGGAATSEISSYFGLGRLGTLAVAGVATALIAGLLLSMPWGDGEAERLHDVEAEIHESRVLREGGGR
jgi:hypothetical protein